jgi:hypothetical protein
VEEDFEFSASWYGFRRLEGVSSEMQEKGCSQLSKFSKGSSQLHLSGKKCLSPRRNSTRLELSRTKSLKVAARVPRRGWGVPIL